MNPEKAAGLSPELQLALQPLLAAIESVNEPVREYTQRIERKSVITWSIFLRALVETGPNDVLA